MSTKTNSITFATADASLKDRLQTIATMESKRNGFKVPMSAIIRKSIDIGLTQLEIEIKT